MIQVLKSAAFDSWLRKLKDRDAKARILVRIARLGQADIARAKAIAGQWSGK